MFSQVNGGLAFGFLQRNNFYGRVALQLLNVCGSLGLHIEYVRIRRTA